MSITLKAKEAGLTFIELIFVISIFAIMASIVLFRFDNFSNEITLNNLTQDIALRVVEAQKSAISGAINQSIISAGVTPAYGVYFSSDASATADSTQFTYFTDLDGNKEYAKPPTCPPIPTTGNECISVTSITTGEYVSAICYTDIAGSNSCMSPRSEAHISFVRPFPDAKIIVKATTNSSPIPASRVFVEITSRSGSKKTVAVESIGKVWVYDGEASTYGTP